MNKVLEEYNKKLGELSCSCGFGALFSPTLCRVEAQTDLFRKIFLNDKNKSKSKYNLINFFKNFGFFLKPIRDIIFISKTERIFFKKNIDRLFITYGDYRNESRKNNWREEVFRGLNPNKRNIILVISLGRTLNDVLRNIKYLRTCNQKNYLYSIYSLVNLKDILIAFLNSHFYFLRNLFGIISKDIYVNKKNIKSSVIKSLFKDYITGNIYTNCFFLNAWINLLKSEQKLIIFPWESHCWERLLMNQISVKGRSKNIKTIGYQHTGFSYGLLQHFSTEFDSKQKIHPNVIFSCGETQKKKLDEIEGLADVMKMTVGSLRCKSKPNKRNLYQKANLEINTISVAMGYNQNNYEKIIEDLKKINKNIKIFLFVHPLNYKFKPNLDPKKNIVCKKRRDNNIIKSSDLLIVDDNSLMIEGWTLGVPTIIYDSDSFALTKRDWNSPILHFNEENISQIGNNEFMIKLNNSIENYLDSNYSSKYFYEINFSKFNKAISNIF